MLPFVPEAAPGVPAGPWSSCGEGPRAGLRRPRRAHGVRRVAAAAGRVRRRAGVPLPRPRRPGPRAGHPARAPARTTTPASATRGCSTTATWADRAGGAGDGRPGRGLADRSCGPLSAPARDATSCSTPSRRSRAGTPSSASRSPGRSSSRTGSRTCRCGWPHRFRRPRPPAPSRRSSGRRGRRAARGAPWSPAGERRVEEVEVGEPALVAGPGQHAGHVVRRGGAAGERVEAEPQPVLVVGEELVDAGVRGRARPARARAAGRGPAAARTLVERAQEVAQRLRTGTGSKPIDGVIVGSTWSPAKSRPAARSAKT